MRTSKYTIGELKFYTEAEYRATWEDIRAFQSLEKRGKSKEEIAWNYVRELRERKLRFSSVLGIRMLMGFEEDAARYAQTLTPYERAEAYELKYLRAMSLPLPAGAQGVSAKERLAALREKWEAEGKTFRADVCLALEEFSWIADECRSFLEVGLSIRAAQVALTGVMLCCASYLIVQGAEDYRSYRNLARLRQVQAAPYETVAAQGGAENAYAPTTLVENGETSQTYLADGAQELSADTLSEADVPGGAGEEKTAQLTERVLRNRALKEMNADFSGWLSIPDTGIDYPVMHRPEDNNYYLTHDFEGNQDKTGLLVLDKRCAPLEYGSHLLIHGHHMKSGAMFGTLQEYKDEKYFWEHPGIEFSTTQGEYIFRIASVFVSSVSPQADGKDSFPYYNYIDISDRAAFLEYADGVAEAALYPTGEELTFGDKVMTLSTCDYTKPDGRLVIVGVCRENTGEEK